jgi:hypothetical protein
VPPGEWSEGKLYKFRLERIEACDGASAKPDPAGGPDASRPSVPETSWVGALFTVHAKEPEVFVTPRDLKLRRGGVILSSKYVNPPALSGCKPLLSPRQLKRGESISGFALFEVPRGFRITTDDPIVLSYRPVRWGGARRAEVPIRECLDDCPASSVTRASKPADRASAPGRQKL